jgi:hypothetical protein
MKTREAVRPDNGAPASESEPEPEPEPLATWPLNGFLCSVCAKLGLPEPQRIGSNGPVCKFGHESYKGRLTLNGSDVALCFSCDKAPRKYIDGLCEECHEIAMKASREIAEEDERRATPER